MRIETLVKWAYRKYEKETFTSRKLIRDRTYRIDRFPRDSIYSVVHKSWKMGLLSREKLRGHKYSYRVTDWGRRFIEHGEDFREYKIPLMLLEYILRYGPQAELEWAEHFLAPRLLQRFIHGKNSMNIDPITDIHEAVYDYAATLGTRIRNYFYDEDEESLEEECERDLETLRTIDDLLQRLHPDIHKRVDLVKFDELRDQVIDETLQKLRNPRRYTIIFQFPPPTGPIRLKNYENKPNESDKANIKRWIETLENLR